MNPAKIKSKSQKTKRHSQLYYHGMMIPGMIFILLFSYAPMVGLVMAFQDYVPAKGILGSKWVGLKHFRVLFSTSDIWQLMRNTVVIAVGKIVFGSLVAIGFSILLNEIKGKFLKKSVQTIVYLPHFISWVVLASVVANLFNLDGLINQLLVTIGLEKINFLGDSRIFQPLLIWTDVWKEFGYNSIVYLAAITAIDPALHEAAAMDGARWWRRVWHVTLPGMMPIILMMACVSISGVLNAGFEQIYTLYSPLVYDTGDVLDTYVYRVGLMGRQYSFGTAVGLFKSIIGMLLLLFANGLSKRLAQRSVF